MFMTAHRTNLTLAIKCTVFMLNAFLGKNATMSQLPKQIFNKIHGVKISARFGLPFRFH